MHIISTYKTQIRCLMGIGLFLCLSLVATRATMAQSPDDIVWRADFYNNTTLSGPVVATEWFRGNGFGNLFYDTAPTNGVIDFGYSIRFTTEFEHPAVSQYDYYSFDSHFSPSDNGRVLLDGVEIYNTNQTSTATVNRDVPAGKHRLVVEFRDTGINDGEVNWVFSFYPFEHEGAMPTIDQFSISPNLLDVTTSEIQVRWQTSNAEKVNLAYTDQYGQSKKIEVSADGNFSYPFNWSQSNENALYQGVYLEIVKDQGHYNDVLSSRGIRFTCTSRTWFFANPPATCPNNLPDARQMSIQQFEHGAMIWVEGMGIFVFAELYGDRFHARLIDNWHEGLPVDSNPNRTPPPGFFKPLYGFGMVWSQQPYQQLGWALSPEQTYTGYIQCSGYQNCYLSAPGNQIYMQGQVTWRILSAATTAPNQPPPANVPGGPTQDTPSPPTTGSCIIPPSGPWPPCATGGGGSNPSSPPPTNSGDCVIPPSGPWPPCAR